MAINCKSFALVLFVLFFVCCDATRTLSSPCDNNLGDFDGSVDGGIKNAAGITTPVGSLSVSHGANAAIKGGGGATTTSNVIAPLAKGKLFGLSGDAGANAGIQNGARIKTPFGTIGASHGVNAAIGGGAGGASTSNIVTPVGEEKSLGVGWNAGAKAGIGGNAGITTPLGSVRAGVGANGGANAGATGGRGGLPSATTP